MNHGTVAPSQHQELKEPGAFDPLAETYSFKRNRIKQACWAVVCGLFGLGAAVAVHILGFSVWRAPDGTFNVLAGFFSVVFVALPASLIVLGLLRDCVRRPYELRIAPSGRLRFVSVTGSTDLRTADINALAGWERATGKLFFIRVEHGTGSITLDGNEAVFASLSKLVPAALVSRTQLVNTFDNLD